MKTRQDLLAGRARVAGALQALEGRTSKSSTSCEPDGAITVRVPITPDDMKQASQLKGKIARLDAALGTGKSKTKNARPGQADATSAATSDLLTERMLAQRWHCSVSRLQRWRADGRGPSYLKIGGKVLYRREDVLNFEGACLVTTEPAIAS